MQYSTKLPLLLLLPLLLFFQTAFAEGSKDVTPDSVGVGDGENTYVGYLQHDDNGSNDLPFLKTTIDSTYRLYTYVKPGETLYYGVRRKFRPAEEGNFADLILTIKINNGSTGAELQRDTLLRHPFEKYVVERRL